MKRAFRWVGYGLFLVSAGFALLSTEAGSAEQAARPAINRPYYEDPAFERWLGIFERPGREVFDERERIVAAVDLETGMSVADIGAGTGLFTRLFARQVGPQGRVYAVDISEEFIDNIERRVQALGLENVVGIVNTQNTSGLAPDSVELAFVCNTYHHFERPAAMMRSIHAALRPGGRLIVIDFRKIEGFSSQWVMQHVRADKQTVINEVESSGFQLQGEKHFLERNYYLEFVRSRQQ